ncbi:MAG: hypothetical protein KDD69_18120 [Bdellovibrionales bacterium]|nr:hypothetical protein [Bdellovibrionales bacterium]
MKRKAIEQKLADLQSEAVERIQAAPIHSFLVGIVLGVSLMWFGRFLIPLLLLAVLVTVGLWLFGEQDDPFAERRDAVPPEGPNV